MNIYKLTWKSGETEYATGDNIAAACHKAGIGNGALSVLDYWAEVSELPDQMKRFEIISNNEKPNYEIINPVFINQLKQTEFESGSITEISFANRIFRYQYVEKSPTAYLYKQI